MGNPTDISTLWTTTEGEVISPNAPAGGGGAGRFRTAIPLGTDAPAIPALPEPNAPAARYLVTPDPDNASGTATNPPPVTKTGTTPLKKLNDPSNDVDVDIEVLADGTNSSETGQAHTKLDPTGLQTHYPGFQVDAKGKVSKLDGKFTQSGKVTIQIRYKPGTDKAAASAYGRGTKAEDKAAGNVSIGFHESCHVKDMLAWMKAHRLPAFKGKVGMTEAEFDQAKADHGAATDQYFKDASDASERLTDEIGSPTRSQWLAANP